MGIIGVILIKEEERPCKRAINLESSLSQTFCEQSNVALVLRTYGNQAFTYWDDYHC